MIDVHLIYTSLPTYASFPENERALRVIFSNSSSISSDVPSMKRNPPLPDEVLHEQSSMEQSERVREVSDVKAV